MDNSVRSEHLCEIEFARLEDVSDIIVGLCREHPRLHRDFFDCIQFYSLLQNRELLHQFQCGSTAEFYIETIYSCIGDKDVMKFPANVLLFTEDIPVLPDDIRGLVDKIDCYQMIPYHDYPGFVKLRRFGNMTYNWDCKRFHCQNASKLQYLTASNNPLRLYGGNPIEELEVFGPAVKNLNTDSVPCYWCPQWPKEAQSWLYRQRFYGWPTTDNINEIIQSGCHVVFAKHPACRDDKFQWRLSFSGAELYLIQSWTPVQQIVYHLLRFIAKIELIKKNRVKEDEVLSTYHFKTLMMWRCEEMPSEFWSSLPVINICCCLLRHLSEWLSKRFCPNYFIPEANLFHEGMNQKIIDETIERLNEFCNFSNLSDWFAVKYILPTFARVLTVEDTTKEVIDAGYGMQRTLESMDAGKLGNFDCQFSVGFWYCFDRALTQFQLDKPCMFQIFISELCFSWNHRRETLDDDDNDRVWFRDHVFRPCLEFASRFPQFGKVIFIMFAVHGFELKQVAYDGKLFTEFVRDVSWHPKVLHSKHHNFPKPSKGKLGRSVVLFLRAQELMENLTGLNNPQEFKLLSQFCKGLLRNVICCDDLKPSIRNVALVYMAGLYFAESDYESAIDLSSKLFSIQALVHNDASDDKYMLEEKEKKQKETLNALWLFYIDYVIEIIGFCLLFRQFINNVSYKRGQYGFEMYLLPEDYSHYLAVSSEERWLVVNQLGYTLQVPTFHLSESHNEIAIDLCSTILNTQKPSDDQGNDDEEDEELEENEKNKLKAQCVLRFSESGNVIETDLSSIIFTNQPPTHNVAKETMNAVCLLYIDDIAAIIGFCLIFRRIRDDFQYNKRRYFLDLRLTPEVFAQYLITSSYERKPKAFRQRCDLHPTTFPMDKILMTMTNRKSSVLSKLIGDAVCVYQRTDPIIESESTNKISFRNEYDIKQLLMEYSLESMASFYSDISIDFTIHCSPVDCYRAAYLYKCRKYSEVLQLCKEIFEEPDLQRDLELYTFANVIVLPPFDIYFDTDIQCLLGLHTLAFYLSPQNEDLCKLEGQNEQTFQQCFAQDVYSRKFALSSILVLPYYLKSHYFLRRHFLARYLKLRCLIDCSHSHLEALSEFKKLKSHLPFEHIICSFLQQKTSITLAQNT